MERTLILCFFLLCLGCASSSSPEVSQSEDTGFQIKKPPEEGLFKEEPIRKPAKESAFTKEKVDSIFGELLEVGLMDHLPSDSLSFLKEQIPEGTYHKIPGVIEAVPGIVLPILRSPKPGQTYHYAKILSDMATISRDAFPIDSLKWRQIKNKAGGFEIKLDAHGKEYKSMLEFGMPGKPDYSFIEFANKIVAEGGRKERFWLMTHEPGPMIFIMLLNRKQAELMVKWNLM